MDLNMKRNSQSQKLQVQQPAQAPRQSEPNPDPGIDLSGFHSRFYHQYLAKEAEIKRRGGNIVPINLQDITPASTSTSVDTTSHHPNRYHPYSRNESNLQAPPPPWLRLSNPDEFHSNWTGYKNSAQVTPKYYDPRKYGSVIPVMPKVPPPQTAASASASPRTPPPSDHQAVATLNTQPSNLPPAVNTIILNNGDDFSDKIEIIDGQEIKLTSNENCCSLSLPLSNNLQRRVIKYDEKRARLKGLNFRYNIDMLNRVEIRMTSLAQAVPDWELFIKQGQPLVQSYTHPIKQTEKDRLLRKIKTYVRRNYLQSKEKFACWLSPSERCPHEPFLYHNNLCKVHFKETEKQRKCKIKELVDQEFSRNLLKFVIGRDFLGVVTDPDKFHVHGYEGDIHVFVTRDTVKKLLGQLVKFELQQFP